MEARRWRTSSHVALIAAYSAALVTIGIAAGRASVRTSHSAAEGLALQAPTRAAAAAREGLRATISASLGRRLAVTTCPVEDALAAALDLHPAELTTLAEYAKTGASATEPLPARSYELGGQSGGAPAPCASDADKLQCARLVHMRLVNALYDADVLPLDFVSGRRGTPSTSSDPAQRARIHHPRPSAAGQRRLPQPHHASARTESALTLKLTNRFSNIYHMGTYRYLYGIREPVHRALEARLAQGGLVDSPLYCVEWDTTNLLTAFFRSICGNASVALLYEGNTELQRISTKMPAKNGRGHMSNAQNIKPSQYWHLDLASTALSHTFPRRSFKLVMAVAVWEHLPSPFRSMKNLYELVAPGGVVICGVPYSYPFHGGACAVDRASPPPHQHLIFSISIGTHCRLCAPAPMLLHRPPSPVTPCAPTLLNELHAHRSRGRYRSVVTLSLSRRSATRLLPLHGRGHRPSRNRGGLHRAALHAHWQPSRDARRPLGLVVTGSADPRLRRAHRRILPHRVGAASTASLR